MWMAIFLRDSGKMTKQMEKVSIITRMVQVIKGNGLKISKMGKGLNPGLMVLVMKDSTRKVKNMAMGFTNGRMGQFTRAIGITTKSLERGPTNGLTGECSLDNGWITTCMDKEFTLEKMAGSMWESFFMIKSIFMGYISGLMGERILASGQMESRMGMVYTH